MGNCLEEEFGLVSGVSSHDKAKTKLKTKMSTKAGQSGDIKKSSSYDIRAKLLKVLDDPHATAQAKASAGRTLAEIDGLIGRHQLAPQRGSQVPVGNLSRAELEHELDRLRAVTRAK